MNTQYIALFFNKKTDLNLKIATISEGFAFSLYIKDESDSIEANNVENIEICLSNAFNLRENVVRAKPFIDALHSKITEIQDTTQIKKLAVFLEMTWAVRTPSGDIYLREIQEALLFYLENKPNLTIFCVYDETILLDEQLLTGLFSHPTIYTHQGFVSNPYFLPINISKKKLAQTSF